MSSMTQPVPHSSKGSAWRSFIDYVAHRRVQISVLIFVALIAEDVWNGIKPHNFLNVHDVKGMVGLGLVMAGIGLRSWAAGTLHKMSEVTASGPYNLIRHPLYVGSFMIMIGFCLLIDDPENIWFVLGPFLLLYLFRIQREERNLKQLFGEQWENYTRSTPRFFPRRLPKTPWAGWSWAQWKANKEYRLVGSALLGLFAVEVWQTLLTGTPHL
jgi:protein-S-isoprenylcysteine O-methyltransferase Ste14